MEKQTDKIKIKEEEGERGGKEGSYRASIACFFSFFFFSFRRKDMFLFATDAAIRRCVSPERENTASNEVFPSPS